MHRDCPFHPGKERAKNLYFPATFMGQNITVSQGTWKSGKDGLQYRAKPDRGLEKLTARQPVRPLGGWKKPRGQPFKKKVEIAVQLSLNNPQPARRGCQQWAAQMPVFWPWQAQAQ
jgi:hypothetical protein